MKKINKIQRNIIAISIPLILIIITLGITENIFDQFNIFDNDLKLNVHWYYYEYTWYVWLITILLISIFEFWFFRDK